MVNCNRYVLFMIVFYFFFFFQAEDGIRDYKVTGVQTCALPILGANNGVLINAVTFAPGMVGQSFDLDGVSAHVRVPDSASLHFTNAISIERSEERRVGKECRSRWSPYH